MAGEDALCEQRLFDHLKCFKTIILPRHARDKHRKSCGQSRFACRLASEYAVAMIKGMQGEEGSGYQMMSMAKHYIDYTLEGCTPEENNCRKPQKLL